MSESDNSTTPVQEIIRNKRHSLPYRLRIWRDVARASADPTWNSSGLDRFRKGLEGRLPVAENSVILAACNDPYYSQFAVTMLLSLERVGAPQAVHLHLYQPSAQVLAHIAMLSKRLKYVRLSWTCDPCLLAESLKYRTVYYAAARFLIAATILEELKKPIFCIDVDGVALKPVWAAYDKLRTLGDVGLIFRRASGRPWRKILASAAGFNSTAAGLRFSSVVARSLASLFTQDPRYHLDQIVLYYASRNQSIRADGTCFFDLPMTFADHEFNPSSIICTPKGWHRKNSQLYQSIKSDVDQAFPDLSSVPQ